MVFFCYLLQTQLVPAKYLTASTKVTRNEYICMIYYVSGILGIKMEVCFLHSIALAFNVDVLFRPYTNFMQRGRLPQLFFQ